MATIEMHRILVTRTKIYSLLKNRLKEEKSAEKSGSMTSATHLIPELQKEVEEIFQEALNA